MLEREQQQKLASDGGDQGHGSGGSDVASESGDSQQSLELDGDGVPIAGAKNLSSSNSPTQARSYRARHQKYKTKYKKHNKAQSVQRFGAPASQCDSIDESDDLIEREK